MASTGHDDHLSESSTTKLIGITSINLGLSLTFVISNISSLCFFTYYIRLVLSQICSTLTKFVEKNNNIYIIKYMHYQNIYHDVFNEKIGIVNVIIFSIILVKVGQI